MFTKPSNFVTANVRPPKELILRLVADSGTINISKGIITQVDTQVTQVDNTDAINILKGVVNLYCEDR